MPSEGARNEEGSAKRPRRRSRRRGKGRGNGGASGPEASPRGDTGPDAQRGGDDDEHSTAVSSGGASGGRSRSARPPAPAEGPRPETGFDRFGLPEPLLRAIAEAGYLQPTEIQERLIPLALEGRDAVARSRTGTGKTCAFLVPAACRLEEVRTGARAARGPARVLVVVPTRELALQVAGEAERIFRHLPIETACLYGGQRIRGQIDTLQRAAIAVGTPGRLLDHIGRGTLDARHIRTLVLDEVDRMYDLGFREDVDRILHAASGRDQTLLLSATINEDVESLIRRYVRDPVRISIESRTMTVEEVNQSFYVVDPPRKSDLLIALLKERKPDRAIVFARTKSSVDRLAHRLRRAGVDAEKIHSGLAQRAREEILGAFRAGRFPILVATDVAARGLDIGGVTHVINHDIPETPEDYVHRVGRTARMGQEGWAVTFVTPEDGRHLTAIEKWINAEIEQEVFPGFERARPEEAAPEPAPPTKPTGLPPWTRVVRRRR